MINTELRELDAWIAEHVMGWKPTVSLCQPRGDEVPRYWSIGGGRSVHMKSFNPTTDPAAAMTVLKKILTDHPRGSAMVGYAGGFNEQWSCGRANAKTLELAICECAKQLFTKEAK